MSTLGAPEIAAFRAHVARLLGLGFDESKTPQLAALLRERLERTRRSAQAYLNELERASPEEIVELGRGLTVGETYFLRSADQYRALESLLAERLRAAGGPLRLLCAGCSSGEEAYSLAIVGHGLLAQPSTELSIVAVDINSDALEKARRARFSSWALRETPEHVIARWFRRDGRDFVLDEALRSSVRFEHRNLNVADPELWQPSRYDAIFCRNVLMYFTTDAARALVARMASSLAPEGHLFLGHAETLRGLSEDFRLQHTHGTFYYQLAESRSGRSATRPAGSHPGRPRGAAQGSASASSSAASYGWFEAIRGAAERIHALSSAASPPAASRAVPNRDLERAVELLERERFADALALVRALPPESAEHPEVLLLTAVLLAHHSELGAAEEACRKLLALDPSNAGAHYVLALCRENAGDQPAAIDRHRRAVYLAPAFSLPRMRLGLLARRNGDREGARRELGQALHLLAAEDAALLRLFGGGFGREALMAMCRAELSAVGGNP